MRYIVLIRKGEVSGYVAECPAIPGCVSQGETLEEVRENIRDAIRSCLGVINEEAREKAEKTDSRIAQISL